MLFTFPSRYWFTIGRTGVLRLGRWSSQIPTGLLVPCGTQGTSRSNSNFNYGPITLFGGSFQSASSIFVGTFMEALQPPTDESIGFGLVRVRSPLLPESRLISFPLGTEMFHFPRSASCTYGFSAGWALVAPRVPPFRHRRVKGCLAPHRRFSQPATSFFASVRLGIHHPPLVA